MKKGINISRKAALRGRLAIIGDPVAHSLSPVMQNAAFKARSLPFRYEKIRLRTRELKPFFKKLKNGGFRGLNVTVPHKESVLPYLDGLSPDARLIGAVNTVVVGKNDLKGFNTDGAGYLLSLKKEMGFSPKGKRIFILGAGGAARAILTALCLKGARSVIVVNRSPARAQRLVKEFERKFPNGGLRAFAFDPQTFQVLFPQMDLLVNTTSAGLKGAPLPPLPLKRLPKKAIVSDIVYKPRITPLLQAARKAGRRTHDGLGMLLYQGTLAFELWTGKKAPVAVMKRALLKELSKRPHSKRES